ncbi:Cytochrome c oxidase assembly protein cox15 [Stylosanthes scabra]|uniref:Cytochrome c oxidase assembly protein cox15 n=1 Tax=Stylosanthes scabra TaxID=79078 RepID=A0ABU6Q6E5_9FABA|nr:Cytochrome c oxidase assembly protein cox15 [Stylosanthes scabra]
MLGRRLLTSILRRTKDSSYHNHHSLLRSTKPHDESFKLLSPPIIARHYFINAFRSLPLPKGQNVPCFRSFSRTASIGVEQKEGLKMLVSGGARAQKAVGSWLFLSAAWVYSLVVLGGITRLTRSGLSMTDWKFTGTLPPMSDEEWHQEFEKYKQSPEYKR